MFYLIPNLLNTLPTIFPKNHSCHFKFNYDAKIRVKNAKAQHSTNVFLRVFTVEIECFGFWLKKSKVKKHQRFVFGLNELKKTTKPYSTKIRFCGFVFFKTAERRSHFLIASIFLQNSFKEINAWFLFSKRFSI